MCRLHLLRQTLQGFLLQLRRHPVKGFGNAAGDAGKSVAVAAEGDRIAERMVVDCHACASFSNRTYLKKFTSVNLSISA